MKGPDQRAEVIAPEPAGYKRASSLSLVLQLELPDPFHLCGFVLLLLLFPVLVQIPVLFFLF